MLIVFGFDNLLIVDCSGCLAVYSNRALVSAKAGIGILGCRR